MMFTKLSRYLFSTLRGRLIVSVALVHAVMMALFIADLTARQRAMLLAQQIEETTALSQTLAISAAGWIAADDIAGLLELVEAQKRYPELLFAMLVDEQGRVLADTDTRRRGLYLQDLPRDPRQALLSRNPALVDVAVPAMIGARHVGWARVGIGQKEGSRKLAEITRDGVLYALAAILIGSAVAWFMGLRITKRLYFVQQTINAVSSGDRTARSSISGDDEAAVMAREFNSMLDKLAGRDAELCASEERFRLVFENSPVSIWEEDFSGVKTIFDDLKKEGITDLEGYFEDHPETVRQFAELVNILDVNQAALALHGAESKEELFAGLVNTFTPESFDTFRQELVCLWNGGTEMVRDAVVKTLAGEPRHVTVYFSVCPGYEGTLAKILVSLADITDRKRAEEALRTLNEELEERVCERTVELEAKNAELHKMNKLFVGRELRMVELKERIRELEERK